MPIIIQDKKKLWRRQMSSCKHKYVKYAGEQETLVEGKYLKLYHCLNCKSTITLNNNPNSRIIDNNHRLKKINGQIAFSI